MGKRKSRIGKQKQAKAKHQGKRKTSVGSSLGGSVALSKGLSSKFQQQVKVDGASVLMLESGNLSGNSNGNILGSSSNHKRLQKQLRNLKKKQQSQQQNLGRANPSTPYGTPTSTSTKPRKVFLSPLNHQMSIGGSTNALKNGSTNDEQAEFRRQMASMQERQAAHQHASRRQLQKKSSLLKEGGAVQSLVQNLQPASFSMEKNTAELLQETVHQMESMTGVGKQTMESFKNTPVRNNQSWAVMVNNQNDRSITAAASNLTGVQVPKPTATVSNNSFAALQEDSEEEEFEAQAKLEWGVPALQIAPASFTLLPRTTPTPATTPQRSFGPEDIDPDL